MQQQDYQPLCDAIRQYCAERHWYGAEAEAKRPGIAEDDPRRFGFVFPPATKEQIRETETILGFALPAVLQALYTQLANGGFGPEYGLRVVLGGAPGEPATMVDWYQQFVDMGEIFDLAGDEVQPGKNFFFPDQCWPRSLLALFDWGCGSHVGVDTLTGHVLGIHPWENANTGLIYVTNSLEAFLLQWIQGKLDFNSAYKVI